MTTPSHRPNGASRSSDEASGYADETSGYAIDLQELEEELCRLGGVLAVRVVADRNGRPIEVHVLSDRTKPAKQTVRDVRAVAQTVFGLEIDHRIVSVAQFDNSTTDELVSGPQTPRQEARLRLVSVRFDTEELRARAQVVLGRSEREHTGYAEGSVAGVARPQLVASAALDALRQIEPTADAMHLASADITRIGKERVALVVVVYVEPPMEVSVSGSAVVRRGRDDAVARALLDATNRRMSRVESGHAAH